jgi:3-hydroxymyristoyl/3-hydroxydecanoyl-(acyl carrier protein) dehydratase
MVLDRDLIGAVVVPTDAARRRLAVGARADLVRELRDHLAHSTERIAIPRRWRFVDALPVNRLGKSTTTALASLFLGDDARTIPPSRVVESAPGRVEIDLEIVPELAYFEGHFPAAPVLPGVVQIDWAVHFGKAHLAVRGTFAGLEAIKFRRVIRPGEMVRLSLEWREDRTMLVFRVHSDAGVHASGRVLFTG